MFLLWMVQRQTGNAALVDLGWTVSVPALHLYFAWTVGGASGRGLLLALLVFLWGLRLGGYLYWTRLRPGMEEEGRYQKLRQQWGERFQSNLFWFYQAQALAAFVLVVVFLPVYRDTRAAIGPCEGLGVAIFLLGWAGVALADSQLNQFKADGANHGKVCQVGLWNYSRHPNYFFECLLWFGWALYGLSSPGGFWALLAPLTILHLVLNVTGIPPTEEQSLRSKGEAYREYQRSTSAFLPWFKRA
jgi:steroid 5-alpha reductase family enzyme